MFDARTRFAIAGVALAAVVAVVVAARGVYDDDTAAALDAGPSDSTIGVIGLVAAGVALVVVLWAFWPARPSGHALPRHTWRDTIVILIVGLLAATLVHQARPREGATRRAPDGDLVLGPLGEPTPAPARPRPAADGTATLLLAATAIAALAGAAGIARRRTRNDAPETASDDIDRSDADRDLVASRRPAALSASDAIAAAQAETDVRRSIGLAFRAAEVVLAPTSMARTASQAPREWLGNVYVHGDEDVAAALRTLVGCYEVARFSGRPPAARERDRALDALASIHESVAARRDRSPV